MSLCRWSVWTDPLELTSLVSAFKLSLIFPLMAFNFLSDSSISFESVMNSKSDDDDELANDWLWVVEASLFEIDELAKLLHSLLNATSLESISFSSCLACFLSAILKRLSQALELSYKKKYLHSQSKRCVFALNVFVW